MQKDRHGYRGRREPRNLWNWIGFMLDAPFGSPSSRFPANRFSATRLIDFTTRFTTRSLLNDRFSPSFVHVEKWRENVFQSLIWTRVILWNICRTYFKVSYISMKCQFSEVFRNSYYISRLEVLYSFCVDHVILYYVIGNYINSLTMEVDTKRL